MDKMSLSHEVQGESSACEWKREKLIHEAPPVGRLVNMGAAFHRERAAEMSTEHL